MQSELKSLQQQLGVTFIHVSHNQGEALAMADRIVVMNDGRFEQVDTPAAIYGTPRTRFVAEFVGTNNIFDGPVISRDDGTATVQTPTGDLIVAANGDARGGIVSASSFAPTACAGSTTTRVPTTSWQRSCAQSNTR